MSRVLIPDPLQVNGLTSIIESSPHFSTLPAQRRRTSSPLKDGFHVQKISSVVWDPLT